MKFVLAADSVIKIILKQFKSHLYNPVLGCLFFFNFNVSRSSFNFWISEAAHETFSRPSARIFVCFVLEALKMSGNFRSAALWVAMVALVRMSHSFSWSLV